MSPSGITSHLRPSPFHFSWTSCKIMPLQFLPITRGEISIFQTVWFILIISKISLAPRWPSCLTDGLRTVRWHHSEFASRRCLYFYLFHSGLWIGSVWFILNEAAVVKRQCVFVRQRDVKAGLAGVWCRKVYTRREMEAGATGAIPAHSQVGLLESVQRRMDVPQRVACIAWCSISPTVEIPRTVWSSRASEHTYVRLNVKTTLPRKLCCKKLQFKNMQSWKS